MQTKMLLLGDRGMEVKQLNEATVNVSPRQNNAGGKPGPSPPEDGGDP
jgi:hypothetical protein